MSDLRPCEHCEKPIARNALRCPHCGGIPKSRTAIQVWITVFAFLMAIVLVSFLAFRITSPEPGGPGIAQPQVQSPDAKPDR